MVIKNGKHQLVGFVKLGTLREDMHIGARAGGRQPPQFGKISGKTLKIRAMKKR